MGLWQGVAMDSLKFHAGPSCPNIIRPASVRPVAFFHPLGHPTPYAMSLCLLRISVSNSSFHPQRFRAPVFHSSQGPISPTFRFQADLTGYVEGGGARNQGRGDGGTVSREVREEVGLVDPKVPKFLNTWLFSSTTFGGPSSGYDSGSPSIENFHH
jgi:hypothetical protein